jgi:hypothetical protein
MGIRSILRPFGIFCSYFVYFFIIWYILLSFGMLHQEKSGNPAGETWILCCFYLFQAIGLPEQTFFIARFEPVFLTLSTQPTLRIRVARWYSFIPKYQLWYIIRSLECSFWSIFCPFVTFCGHLV